MRLDLSLFPRPLAAYVSAALLAAIICLDASAVFAGNTPPSAGPIPPLPQPKSSLSAQRPAWLHRSVPRLRLGAADELATLHAIDTALSSVGDGGAYVWQRGNGLLNGLIRPTSSFKSSSGAICRHIIIRLDSGAYSREIEGIACRDASGAWTL